MKRKALAVLVGASMFSAMVVAQTKTATPPAKPDPALAACMAKLNPTYAAIRDIVAKGRAAGQITPAEEAEFKKIEESRTKDWAAKSQGGVTAAECEAHLKGLEGEKARVTQMAARPVGPDPKVAACTAKFAPTFGEIRAIIGKARAAGEITKAEEDEFAKMEAARTKDIQEKAKGGLTVAECEGHLKLLDAEKARVTAMAANVRACLAKLGPTHASIRDIMAKGRAANQITPAEEAEFKKIEESRMKDWTAKQQGGVTVAECEAHLKGLEGEKARVTTMAARAPAVDPKAMQACMQKVSQTYSAIQTAMRMGRAAGQITKAEEDEFNRIEAARSKDWAAKQQGGLTVAECGAHLMGLETEQKRVAQMVARPPVPPKK